MSKRRAFRLKIDPKSRFNPTPTHQNDVVDTQIDACIRGWNADAHPRTCSNGWNVNAG
jgi:hypothetical protein